jgi:uncharacterized Zn finger protein (UPF0148 family)
MSDENKGGGSEKWICNRCNFVRKQGIGVCPYCGSPEFRMTNVRMANDRKGPREDQLRLPGV